MSCETAQNTWFVENRRIKATEFDSDVLRVRKMNAICVAKTQLKLNICFCCGKPGKRSVLITDYMICQDRKRYGIDGRRIKWG